MSGLTSDGRAEVEGVWNGRGGEGRGGEGLVWSAVRGAVAREGGAHGEGTKGFVGKFVNRILHNHGGCQLSSASMYASSTAFDSPYGP